MSLPILYHGTRRGFTNGGLLLPRATHGGKPTTAPLNPGQLPPPDQGEWAYLTTDLDLAWVYAWHSVGRGMPRVVKVTPLSDVERDPEHGLTTPAYRTRAATVCQVLREPTVTEADARNGWIV